MDAHSVALVQASFEKVAPLGDKVPQIFYDELFTLDPSLRPMFQSDMTEQRKMVLTALTMVVRSLHKPEAIAEPVKALGKRHVTYGVKPAHFATVGSALLNTLQKGLGNEFTPELRQAWVEAYVTLSGMMKEAAYGSANAT
jgi:hemoglobin-like flavoprotein